MSHSASTPAPGDLAASARAKAVSVSVEGLTKNFGKLKVLKDVSFEVKAGEIFVLMGPSGSGKSVLLRHVMGLEAPTAGRIKIDGFDVGDPRTLQHIRLGVVFQAGALFNSLSVYDNLALYPREHRIGSEATIRAKVTHALQILSLERFARTMPSDLSGGMRKRVAIARALVMEPQLLLYDEPTSELDPMMAATISEIIASVKDQFQVTTIVVSHDRDLAMNIAGRVGILMNGELIHVGPPASLRETADARIKEFLNPKIDLKNPRFKELES
ncbi:MAG TPA: ATP-binding cassette domain-containing protein [Opitutaceae bacterium]|nr:ATP-binding cassette domain-containing protein [Opitutaceae bacterium]